MRKLLFLLLILSGCADEEEPLSRPQAQKKPDCLLVFAVDPSSPYRDYLVKQTGLYDFWMESMNNYYRQRIGYNDVLIVTPLTTENISWFHGSPRDFGEEYPNPEALTRLIMSENRESRPFESLAHTLEFLLRLPGVSTGQTPVTLIVMSSMDDSSSDARLVRALTRFNRVGGDIRFYWPNRTALENIGSIMVKSGYPQPQWEFNSRPKPLNFVPDDPAP